MPAATRTARRTEHGISLVMALFAMTVLTLTASTGLLVGSADVRATRYHRSVGQVHFVAESAVSEALQRMNLTGVINFQTDVANKWAQVWGTGAKTFAPLPGFRYSATVTPEPGNVAQAGTIVATATGIEGARNVVVARLVRSDVPNDAPGAIYLAADANTNATFTGDQFKVDGNDRNYTGGNGPNAPVPGIATRNDANTQETIASLSAPQRDNVKGSGFVPGPPAVPSVRTVPYAPSVALMNQIMDTLIASGTCETHGGLQLNGNETLGTPASPECHYYNGGSLTLNGTADGAGILMVEGDLKILGTFNYKGLVLVRGATVIGDNLTQLIGNATIYGSIWTQHLNLKVGGSAIAQYSSQALALANQIGLFAFPVPMKVTLLADCAQVEPGAAGCPTS